MEDVSILDESWHVLLSLFPQNWAKLAKETGAMVRTLRTFPSEEAVMRTLLIHIAQGYSLRETTVKAKVAGISDVSDVALLKRLRLSEGWFKALCQNLLRERMDISNLYAHGIAMRLVDGTNVKEPGKTGSLWRIHYSMSLPDLCCDYFQITATKGVGTGETYKQFPAGENDCIIGDRVYSTPPGVEYLEQCGAYSLVRVNTQSLPIYAEKGRSMNLLSSIKKRVIDGGAKEWNVYVKKADGSYVEGRLCIIRKSEHAIQTCIKKLKREACKQQSALKPSTLEFAKYIILFTTLPKKDFPATSVLEWYRIRWQIELVFKRLKSLIGLGHLPKYDERSSRAWLYGKLFVGLLVEKLIQHANEISPWGYSLEIKQN